MTKREELNMELSRNVQKIEISGIRRFYNKVKEIEGAISLTLGEPDFHIPIEVKEAIITAVKENKTSYTPNPGIVELRREISKYLEIQNIEFSEDEICVTVGGSEALLDTFLCILNEGDKVLVPDIAYSAYESCVKLAGGEVLNYKLKEDLSIDFQGLREVIKRERPKAIVLSYPSNPTGMLLSKMECEELYEILKDEEIFIISDEMYSSIVFEEYYSVAMYKELKNKLILVGGFSKMFSMTGIRVGYVAAHTEILNNLIKVHQYNVSCAPSIGQYGALEGLKKSMYHIDYIKKELKERMDFVYDRLVSMGLEVIKPQGAFYIFPSIKKFGLTSEEFAERLLKEAKVAVVPGSAFGMGGEGYIRISFCYSRNTLEKALRLMEDWILQLPITKTK